MNGQQMKFIAFRVYRFRDAEAYRVLYREYAPAILRFIARKVRRPDDAEEMTDEVFLRGWEYMTANEVENPRALLYKIASNEIASFYRSAKPTEAIDDALESMLASSDDVARQAEISEEMSELHKKLASLRPEYREVLQMKYVEELTVEEIAITLNKSTNNIHVLLFRARRALKKV